MTPSDPADVTAPEEEQVSEVVGRGTVLAGRYRIVAPAPSDLEGASAWQASDQILDRPVRVRVLEAGAVAPALDAARRAALVTDSRLVRVLDVGTHEGAGYVVSEQVTGPSLAQLVARAPLTPDQARAVVGEAASALEVARRRGVHHLALRPSVLHVNSDGRVLIGGLAIDAALLGTAAGDARTTTRSDTVGLVRLLYTALTGRWPADPERPGSGAPLPDAPRVDGWPALPSDLVPGVPADLDTLCGVTLGPHDDGPHSPAELVRGLEPWGEIRAVASVPDAAEAGMGGAVAAASIQDIVSRDTEPVRVQRQSVRNALNAPAPGANRPGTPPPAAPARTSTFGAPGPGALGAEPGPTFMPPPPPVVDEPHPTVAYGRPAPATPPPAYGTQPYGAAQETQVYGGPPPVDAMGATTVMPADPSTAATPPPFASHGVPRSAAAAGVPRGPVTPPVRRPTGYRPDDAGLPPAVPPFGEEPGGAFEELGWEEPQDEERRRFDPTKLVLALVGVAVVIGLVVAISSLFSSLGGDDPGPAAQPGTEQTPGTPDAGAPQGEPSAPAEQPEAPAAGPPVIASSTSFDPSDADGEHQEAVARAHDGDPATFWYTQTYKRDDFAGFKDAVGYVVTLQAPASVSRVTLNVNGTGGNVEIRATDPANPGGGTVLASGPVSPTTEFTFDPTELSSISVWITQLPTAADGGFRLELAEIALG